MAEDWPAWTPGDDDTTTHECARCGTAVSPDFFRVWNVDGVLDGCRDCLSRSERFSRALDKPPIEETDHDPDAPNAKKPPGGVQRQG